MNNIPLNELNVLRRIQAHFDGAYVNLLTKCQNKENDQESGSENESKRKQLVSEQGDVSEQSDDESSVDMDESVNDEPQFQSMKPELVSIALSFAKLMNKSLLATERATQLENQVCMLQREICTLRALATNNHELCLSQNVGQTLTSKLQRKPKASNLIAFKAAVEQEMDYQIQAQNKAMQAMEQQYKNQIFGLTLVVEYLKKEIAGRIQQMQIYEFVYGTEEETDEKKISQLSNIWTQIVYEIALHRHKTIVRLANISDKNRDEASSEYTSVDQEIDNLCTLLTNGCPATGPQFVNFGQLGQSHHASFYIEKGKPIGLWISGGADRYMPLIIQKVEVGSVAASCGQLSAGDIILSIQNFDMIGTTQLYAAQLLKSLSGWCRLGIVRIPVSDVERTLANRDDFKFELLYDNFITPNDDQESDQNESVDGTKEEITATATDTEESESESFTNSTAESE